MSHVSNISTDGIEFDLPFILSMCERRGWTFIENQKTFKWYGRFMNDSPIPEGFTPADYGHCDHAIRIPGCSYELGLVKGTDGYNVLADFWMDGGLNTVLGEQGELFRQLYNMEKDICWAEENDYAWEETKTEELVPKLVVYQEGGEW